MDFNIVGAAEEGLRSSLSQFGTPSAWRFSDLGKCLRCQTLKRLGFNQRADKLSLKSLFNLEMGHVIEREALEWLSRSSNIDILSKQVRVELRHLGAKGTIDALARVGNALVPIEIKSTRDKALEFRIPYPNHEKQAGAYAWALNLSGSFLLYIGRDGTFKQCWVENDQKLRDEVTIECETLNLYWESIPERPSEISDEAFYQIVESYLPPAPKMVLQPILDKDGNPTVYKRAGPWGTAGTVKTELRNEGNCHYCQFPDYCCFSDDTLPEMSVKILGPEVPSPTRTDLSFSDTGTVHESGIREDGNEITGRADRERKTRIGKGSEARILTQEGWKEVPNEIIPIIVQGEYLADTTTSPIPERQGNQ